MTASVFNRKRPVWVPVWLLAAGLSFKTFALDLSLPSALDDPFATEAVWSGRPAAAELKPAGAAPALQLPEHALSLAELTELALANHPLSRQAWAQVQAGAAALGMAESAYLPSVTLTTSLIRTQPLSTSGLTSMTQTRYGPGLTLNYVLYDFGKRAADVDAAGYRLLVAELNRNRVLQDVVLAVEQAYYQMQGVDALVEAGRRSLESAETSLKAAEVRRASGLATLGDVYRARTAAGQAKLNLQRSLGEWEKARGLLAHAIGAAPNQTIRLEAWPAETQTARQLADVDNLLQDAASSRPDLMAAEAQVRAARANVGALQSQGLPSLEVVANDTWTYFLENKPDSFSYNIGLQLKIPLFSGFQNHYAIRQGRAQLAQAEAGRDQAQRQAALEVWQAYFDLQTAGEAVASAQSLQADARRAEEAALARYRAGAGNLLELLTAQADSANARLQDVQAKTDWHVNLAKLGHALGGGEETVR